MLIAAKITLTSANTGYSVMERLEALWTSLSREPHNLPPRVAFLVITYLESDTGYVVPSTGAYSETAGVPAQFGYTFDSGPLWSKQVFNDVGLSEINLGSPTAGSEWAIMAWTD